MFEVKHTEAAGVISDEGMLGVEIWEPKALTRQNVMVESDTAQALIAHASVRGMTLMALMNEILEAVARVYRVGGSADEIYSSWNANRMSKEIGGAPFVPQNLVQRMVERIYQSDREWISKECFEAGRFIGRHLRAFYPAIEDLQGEIATLPPFFAEQGLEVQRLQDTGGRQGKIQVRAAVDPEPGLTACAVRLIAGLLSAYSFQIVETRVADGSIEVVAMYDSVAEGPLGPAATEVKEPK